MTDATTGTGDGGTNAAQNQAMLSALRSVLIAIGGALAAHGVTTVYGFSWETISGVILVVAPLLWGIWQKYQADRNLIKAQTKAVQAGVAARAIGAVPPIPAADISPAQAQTIIAAHAP